jgi:hypothetical protein
MRPVPPVPFECLTALSVAIDENLADRGIPTRASLFSLCIEAIEFGREVEPSAAAVRAGSAAHLLLELACPDLDEQTMAALAETCGRAARIR